MGVVFFTVTFPWQAVAQKQSAARVVRGVGAKCEGAVVRLDYIKEKIGEKMSREMGRMGSMGPMGRRGDCQKEYECE